MEKIVRMTFSIPASLKERLDKRPEINWPEIFKQGILKRLDELKKFEALKAQGVI